MFVIPWYSLYRDFRYTVVFGIGGVRYTGVSVVLWFSLYRDAHALWYSLYRDVHYTVVFVIVGFRFTQFGGSCQIMFEFW